MEIVTWVLEGSLVHQDSTGHNGVIYPGLAQRMSAGTGILHSERNDSWRLTGSNKHDEPVHFVQMWVPPDTERITPGYEQLDIGDQLDTGELTLVASGMPQHGTDRAISIRQEHAALWAARLPAGQSVRLPSSPLAHVFIARGSAELEGAGVLDAGDAARVAGSEGQRLAAGDEGAEVLIWEMHAAIAA
jgi:redox-sensitive bicupin YhaK (pirin superfamily)